jgi:hypothetical protein
VSIEEGKRREVQYSNISTLLSVVGSVPLQLLRRRPYSVRPLAAAPTTTAAATTAAAAGEGGGGGGKEGGDRKPDPSRGEP